MEKRQCVKKIIQFLVALIFILQIVPVAKIYAANYTYGVNPIPEIYSSGLVSPMHATKISAGSGLSKINTSALGYPWYKGTNTTKTNNHWVLFENGAYKNGKYYDVKIYYWCNNATIGYGIGAIAQWTLAGNAINFTGGSSPSGVIIDMEYHFLEHGTDVEVDFSGTHAFVDLDTQEGIQIGTGCKDVWRWSNSTVSSNSGNWYVGTKDGNSLNTQNILVSFNSTPSTPLKIRYDSARWYGMTSLWSSNNIIYKISSTSEYIPGNIITTEKVVTGGQYTIKDPHVDYTNYEFSGWYKDDACTEKVTFLNLITSDITVYGKYVEKPKITTEVINGTIDSDILGIPKGNNEIVNYLPNEGYYLESITVDGIEQDIDIYRNKYEFINVISDHHIKVVYEKIPDMSLAITKIWEDEGNIYDTRPKELNISILQNGNVYRTVTLNNNNTASDDSNKWQMSVNVPKYDSNGKEITYTIKEDENNANIKFFYETPVYDQKTLTVTNRAKFIPTERDEYVEYKIIVSKDIINDKGNIATQEDFDKVNLDFDNIYKFPITLKELKRTVTNTGTLLVESYGTYTGKTINGIVTNRDDLIFNLGNKGYGKYEISEAINQYFDLIGIEKLNDEMNSEGATFTKENGKYYITLSGITGQYEQISVKVTNQIKPDRPYNDRNEKTNLFMK